jgi:Na+-transporting methylmalonyl-CoA/oxaloacetate decarboxylase gamma subunit
MSILDELSLGFSTTLIGMAIVFLVLIVLWGVVALEHKFFEATGLGNEKPKAAAAAESPAPAAISAAPVEKSGRSEGSLEAAGITDEQTAVILSAVSEASDIPMNEMRVKSIRESK